MTNPQNFPPAAGFPKSSESGIAVSYKKLLTHFFQGLPFPIRNSLTHHVSKSRTTFRSETRKSLSNSVSLSLAMNTFRFRNTSSNFQQDSNPIHWFRTFSTVSMRNCRIFQGQWIFYSFTVENFKTQTVEFYSKTVENKRSAPYHFLSLSPTSSHFLPLPTRPFVFTFGILQ